MIHGEDVVMVIGVFDLFHRGHVEFLKKAADLGKQMVVVVNGDEMVASYKRRPIFNESDRLEIVRSLRWVDEAVVTNSFDVKPLVKRFRPAKIVHGDDWPRASYLRQIRMTEQDLDELGVQLVFVTYYRGTTTTEIILRVQEINVE